MLKLFVAIIMTMAFQLSQAYGQPAAPIPVEHFARLPAGLGMSISPDGTEVAYIANIEDEQFIVIQNLETGAQRALNASNMPAYGTFWANNDTLMAQVGAHTRLPFVTGGLDHRALLTIDAESLDAEQFIRARRDVGFNPYGDRVSGWEAETGRVLVAIYDEEQKLNLYAVDPANGQRRMQRARGSADTLYWVSDADGARHVRVSYSDVRDRLRVALYENNRWRPLIEGEQDLVQIRVQGFSADGQSLLITHTPRTSPTRVLQQVDLQTGALGDIIYSDPDYDFSHVLMDPHQGHVAGVIVERERREAVWFDPELQTVQEQLHATFEGSNVSLVDWSEDRRRFIFCLIGTPIASARCA